MNTPSFCSIGGVVYWARSPITDDQCLKLLFDYRAERRIAEDRGDDVAATKIGELISQVTAAMDRAAAIALARTLGGSVICIKRYADDRETIFDAYDDEEDEE